MVYLVRQPRIGVNLKEIALVVNNIGPLGSVAVKIHLQSRYREDLSLLNSNTLFSTGACPADTLEADNVCLSAARPQEALQDPAMRQIGNISPLNPSTAPDQLQVR